MGLLSDFYSTLDTQKRRLKALMKSPAESLALGITRFAEDQSDAINTFNNAYPMPGSNTVLNSPQQIMQFRKEAADAAAMQGLNSLGVIGTRFKGVGTPTNVPGFGKAYEVPDNFTSVAQQPLQDMQRIFNGSKPVLQDVLIHPELYRNYPELAKYQVKPLGLFQRDLHGAYDKGEFFLRRTSNPMTAQELEQAHSTLLHEVQHAIQELDKMPIGGMPLDFITAGTKNAKAKAEMVQKSLNEKADAILAGTGHEHERMALFAFPDQKKSLLAKFPQLEAIVKTYKKAGNLHRKALDKESAAYDNYRNLAGEAQARVVQTRFKNPEQYSQDVLKSYDVDPRKLLVKRNI